MRPTRGHRQVDHTADLALDLWAPTEAELLEEAGLAMVAILTEGAVLASNGACDIRIDAVDREDRLVQWMNEVLYWATVQGFLLTSAELAVEHDAVVGRAYGQTAALAEVRTELKSATYHDLRVVVEDGAWRARVVIDV